MSNELATVVLATFRLSGQDSSGVGGGISVASGGRSSTFIYHVDDGICVGRGGTNTE